MNQTGAKTHEPPAMTPAPWSPGPAQAEPPRSAWIELDVARWRQNYRLIHSALPVGVKLGAVIKDEAYGHGLLAAATIAREAGVTFLAVSTLEEAASLRDHGVDTPILLLGERLESELPSCLALDVICCVGEPHIIIALGRLAARAGRRVPVHLKINTGLNRYGVRWDQVASMAELFRAAPALELAGVFSHFAQSDEVDKTYAREQLARFGEALRGLTAHGLPVGLRHLCNSGGFLDLPAAHFDLVRLGILPLGVFPSAVCRRLPGIEPVMSVKARITAIQHLRPGEHVGYGMRYTATAPQRIAVLPLGYGDGFPRVRNLGHVLIRGQRAPVIGGVSMDAITVDITHIPAAVQSDTAVLMGCQNDQQISVHELAAIKNSAAYDVLCGWRRRLPRFYLDGPPASSHPRDDR